VDTTFPSEIAESKGIEINSRFDKNRELI